MKLLLYIWLLVSTTCSADIFEIDDLSLSYRKFFSKNYGLLHIDKNINVYPFNPYHLSIPLPQLESLNDVTLNSKVYMFTNLYFRGNVDVYSFKINWIGSDEFTVPKFDTSLGFEWDFFNMEYTHSFYPIENVYLNNFFPQQDSIMFRFIFLGRKRQ